MCADPSQRFWKGKGLRELIEYMARSLVDHPDQVEVRETIEGGKIRLELSVAKDDMGRVIGRNGRVANAMRVLLRVASAREGKQVTLFVTEPQ